ncbi:hypothetical protein AB5N19_12180 [Seiridium cardinale]
MSSKGLVLVTGANGYIAARTVEAFLHAGYSVRGTVRSSASAGGLLAALPDAVSQGRLEIAVIPDITLVGAFDEAIKGVTAIAHLASPVSLFFTDPDYVIGTAVKGTRSILESTAKTRDLKHFVLMSSIVAVLDDKPQGHIYTELDWNESASEKVAKLGSEVPSNEIYFASKTLAEKEFWKYKQEKKPGFTMTSILPVFVAGPPLVLPKPEQLSDSTRFIWEVLSGKDIPENVGGFGAYVDIRDVARLVLFGVQNGQDTDGERYLAVKGWASPQAAADILRRERPELRDIVKEGAPHSNYLPDFKFPPQAPHVDGSKAVKATGKDWISFETTVLDAAKAFEAYL